MNNGLPPFGFFFLLLLLVIWIYYRFRQQQKRRKLHGRDLWRSGAKRRRQLRLDGASSWSERRRRMKAQRPNLKIADRYLSPSAEDPAPARRERGRSGDEAAGEENP
jgi:hypothetical protein